MCAQDATNNQDVSSKEDCAPNIEASNQSGKKLKLLCNPAKLPKPKAPKARLPKKEELTAEERTKINDYFFDQKAKSIKKARERGWI
jgi:hypothetical protein